MIQYNTARLITELRGRSSVAVFLKTIILNGELKMLTQKELKRQLYYNPNTGDFIRMVARSNCSIAGETIKTKPRHGYLHITVNSTLYPAHRLVWLYMTGEWPEDQIDHINHDKTDNRINNLREVTQQENSRNQCICIRNKSGVTGVHWDKERKRWHAQIYVSYRSKTLGRFDDKFEAICARKAAEVKYGFHENHGKSR